jgi:hypothetical protein
MPDMQHAQEPVAMLAPVRECTRVAALAMHHVRIFSTAGTRQRRRAEARRGEVRSNWIRTSNYPPRRPHERERWMTTCA